MPKSPTKRAYEAPVLWDSIKYGKFVALQNWSVQLLGMCGFFLICHEENWHWMQDLFFAFYSVMMVYGMYFLK